jgi:hypothetical protein
MFVRVLLLGIVALTFSACNRGEVSDIQRNPEGGVDVSVTLTETEVNEVVTEALARMENPLLRTPTVDLQNGAIVVQGEHERRGGGTIRGSFTFTISVQNGALSATVTQADIEGISLSDASIQNFNAQLAENFSQRANREKRRVTFISVSISNTALDITFNVQQS